MLKSDGLRIFVVEDDDWYREFITYTLSLNPDHEIKSFRNGGDLLKSLDENPDMITVDYMLPDMDGISLIKQVKAINPAIETLVISQQEKVDKALELIKLGIYDYFVKADDLREKLMNAIRDIAGKKKQKPGGSNPESGEMHPNHFKDTIIGESPSMQKIFALLKKAAVTDIPVLIRGETGTGKEVAAKAIHFNSKRKNHPLVTVNMSAIPRELVESELFGFEKGAFTGAVSSHPGKLEVADKGTIFLDEIGEMDIHMQVKLLRVLQEKKFERLGGNRLISVDWRIITATNKNLEEEVRNGNFREDLYYRIYGLPIELPPLRQRGDDILLLADYFLEICCAENKLGRKVFSSDAKQKLLTHSFPGNVRELKSVVELGAVLSQGKEITGNDIGLNENHRSPGFLQEEQTIDDYIRHILKRYLEKYGNDVRLVSRKLNLGKSTIYRMIRENRDFFKSSEQTERL